MSTGDDEWQFLMTSVRRYYKKQPHNIIDPHISDQIDSNSFDIFQEIAYQCISLNLMERPTMDKVIERIQKALTIQIQSVLHKLSTNDPLEIRLLANIMDDNSHIYTHQLTTPNSQTQEQAISASHNFSNIFEDEKGYKASSGSVPVIVFVLNVGSMEARENAAASLYMLSLFDENKEYIGTEGAIPPLVLLLSIGSHKGKNVAITILLSLCLDQGNQGRAVKAGGVTILMELLTETRGGLKEDALSLLALLSRHQEGKLAIGKAKAVPLLVEVIGNRSPNNKENAAAILMELCSGHQKYLVEAQEHGLVGKLMDLLQHGTYIGKRKAEQLLEKIENHHHDHHHSDN